MKLFKILFSISFIIVLFSCKKKETTPETPTNTTGNPTNPSTYDGFFQNTAYASFSGSTSVIGSFYNVNVYLKASPSATANALNGINSGTVLLNSTKLKYASGRYYDTTYALNLSTQKNFQLQSNGIMSSITFNNTDSFPNFIFNYNNLINDTLSKALNYTIPLSGFNYADEIKCSLQDLSNFTAFITTTVPKGTNQAVFTYSQLLIFNSNSNISLSVELKKYNTQIINGKNFRFENNTFSSFNVFVKP